MSIFFIYSVVLCAIIFTKQSTQVSLPSSFKRCSFKDPQLDSCMAKAVQDAVSQMTQPFKALGLPSFVPMETPSLILPAGTGAVKFEQKFSDVKFYGFNNCTTDTAKFDFAEKVLILRATFPVIQMIAQYDFNGKILILPIKGKGRSEINLYNITASSLFDFEVINKGDNKQYLKVLSHRDTRLEPGQVTFQLDNLFDGNKQLGDNVNKVMNENWKEVFEDSRGGYEDFIGKLGEVIIGNVFTRVPLEEVFTHYVNV